ncbi:hypothetical protein EXIGLDRAFT_727969 [Exidia glandulosa HHB12029]|uniref:Velvet domain-containing protein n=1 Tax=Exidia glandulosa HHB12029 TaxID=1314781 RepID=A0A165D4L3_EXIGL|nr:hypothetical protein EXIGLDRAFT_727969 [Exidia glandulosa HHB12029]
MARVPSQAKNVPGEPYLCKAGFFKDKWIVAQVAEVQKGDRARKMAGEGGKDARQVDPPPVAQARLLEWKPDGSMTELPADLIFKHPVRLFCTVNLYPYNVDYEADPSAFPDGCPPPSPILPQGSASTSLAVEKQYPPALPSQPRHPLRPRAALTTQLEGAQRVPTMFGAQTVNAQLCKHNSAIYFIFDDLKIRRTGHFMLKYNVHLIDTAFDRLPMRIPMPCVAECWGGAFAVYPSRTAPPLLESTELTKHLNTKACGLISRARWTIRKNRKASSSRQQGESSDEDEMSHPQPYSSTPASHHSRATAPLTFLPPLLRHAFVALPTSPASSVATGTPPSSVYSLGGVSSPTSSVTSPQPPSPIAPKFVRYDPVRDL